MWDEFSEFLPENRVPTSADFNTYPIQIFKIRKESRENSISGNFYLGRSSQKIREIQFHGIFGGSRDDFLGLEFVKFSCSLRL